MQASQLANLAIAVSFTRPFLMKSERRIARFHNRQGTPVTYAVLANSLHNFGFQLKRPGLLFNIIYITLRYNKHNVGYEINWHRILINPLSVRPLTENIYASSEVAEVSTVF